jgi:hypothetical protein
MPGGSPRAGGVEIASIFSPFLASTDRHRGRSSDPVSTANTPRRSGWWRAMSRAEKRRSASRYADNQMPISASFSGENSTAKEIDRIHAVVPFQAIQSLEGIYINSVERSMSRSTFLQNCREPVVSLLAHGDRP